MSGNSEENVHYVFLEPKVTSPTCLFCLTKSLNAKDIQFSIIYDTENQQILTFKKLGANVGWKYILLIHFNC